MHLDKFNRTLIRIKPEKNINCLPIYIKDLSLILDERKILSSLNLSINSDDVTVIMGPNGAGKSIFLKILNGILTPTSGCITWNNKKQFSDTLNTQAFVFQKPILLRRSVIANLDYMDSVLGNKKRISKDRLLKIVQLQKQKNQPARMLSLGEQQRLSLIRSLMLRPNLLLLDEPTANLDPASTKIIEDIILNLKMMGIKIIFVTHNILQAKRIADDIIFLNEGKMVEHLNKQEFFSNSKSIEVQNMESRLTGGDLHLNQKVDNETENDLMSLLADDRQNPEESYEDFNDKQIKKDFINKAIDTLSEREKTIIRLRKFREKSITLDELGQKLKISKERVRQIETKALEKLKTTIVEISQQNKEFFI